MIDFEKRSDHDYHYKRVPDRSKVGLASITLNLSEIEDVCALIAHKKWPDGQFGDDECTAFEVITRTLGISPLTF